MLRRQLSQMPSRFSLKCHQIGTSSAKRLRFAGVGYNWLRCAISGCSYLYCRVCLAPHNLCSLRRPSNHRSFVLGAPNRIPGRVMIDLQPGAQKAKWGCKKHWHPACKCIL